MVKLVGILNITPDSFSDGGLYVDPTSALKQAKKLTHDGASFVDIGAESTNPKSHELAIDEEWHRLEPVLKALPNDIGGFSLDTRHYQIVERALKLRQDFLINDVTTFFDKRMIEIAAKNKLQCVVSHLPFAAKGDILLAHTRPQVNDESLVVFELKQKLAELKQAGIGSDNIIVDPGIGFGKTPELNFKLLRFARHFPDHKVMIGYSRKRFLGQNRMDLEPNLAAGKIAIESGATYLRVHDVLGHKVLLNTA